MTPLTYAARGLPQTEVKTPRQAWRSRRNLSLRLILLIVMGMLAASCSSDSTYLPALLADPMASYEAEGIVFMDSWEQEGGTEFLSGKPVHAQAERIYRIQDSESVEGVVAESVAFAESAGWQVAPASIAPRLYRGSKELDPESGRLAISFGPLDSDNTEGEWRLAVRLDYGSVRLDDTTTSITEGS